MPVLTPTSFSSKTLMLLHQTAFSKKKILKALAFLQDNPLHPGLHIERIINDPTAWSIRVDERYRISLDPEAYNDPGGTPDWDKGIILLRILDHDDLYKRPR